MGQQTTLLEDSDQARPFRQRRYFFYLSGVDEPDCHLTYDIKSDALTLYVPDFDLKRAVWVGPTLGRTQALQRYDISEVKYHSALNDDIFHWGQRQSAGAVVYIIHENQKPSLSSPGLIFNHKTLIPAMDTCREIKDEHEIGLIRRANEISASAHTAILFRVHSMRNEAEIYGKFLDSCISHGARNQSYEIIAASGENASILHYTKNNEPLKGRQFVCLDAGAEWNCYASDVTRTFPIDPAWPSTEAFHIYHVVQRMQEECINRIMEGVRYLDLHILAHKIAIEELLSLGILKGGSMEEILKSGASRVFFPHGLGHHLGLEVHDVSLTRLIALEGEEYQGLSLSGCQSPCTVSASRLKANMVVTVEPGIYFSRLALEDAKSKPLSKYIDMEVVKSYIPVGGVRIEDDILVTKSGFENLTKAPKGSAMLKIIRQGARKSAASLW
ncbi:metalloaminopeptidase [Emydomyces testavorans]|uniref:Xaa-Pro aminopeptidase n=1 Tax=Emydomyces testavorans TaxID=2070801 RepID=A0AAF0DB39_9EURO|nr:metalloaminopeptidase [Emydomyces testavorans]